MVRSGPWLLAAALALLAPGAASRAADATAAVAEPASGGEIGVASWYGARHQGKPTASGARFDMHKLTAAHKLLPLDTRVRVTNLRNGRTVEVTVTDRGPYAGGRVIDLSARAAEALDLKKRGIGRVRIEVIDGDDDAG
jgi:rare lipoprotein A